MVSYYEYDCQMLMISSLCTMRKNGTNTTNTWYFFSAGGNEWWIKFQIFFWTTEERERLIQARRWMTNLNVISFHLNTQFCLKTLKKFHIHEKEVFQVSNHESGLKSSHEIRYCRQVGSVWQFFSSLSVAFKVFCKKNLHSSSPITLFKLFFVLSRVKKHQISHIYGLTDDQNIQEMVFFF